MADKMKVLVTGGAGFIGSHTADRLIKEGYGVRILDNLTEPVHSEGKPEYIPSGAELILGDIRDKETLKNALNGVGAVMHFAAYQDYLPDFSKFFHVNSVGTALIYEIIVENKLPVKKIVVASSQSVMGEGRYRCKDDGAFYPDIRSQEQLERGEWEIDCPRCGKSAQHMLSDESVINPQNQYAISKHTQEMIAINFGRRYDIPSTALRYSIVQGPKQSLYNAYSGVCRIFCLSAFLKKEAVIYEDGKSIRDYVNIDDVVDANMLALEDDRANYQVYNVGGGKPYTVSEFADIVTKVTGAPLRAKVTGEYRFGDTRHIFSDISKLKSLGWTPKVNIEKSVEDYMSYLRRQKDIKDILDYSNKKMRSLGVIRKKRGQ
ncbi:MAG: NAD-dependent epimerase/dehydratase family protein [Candidatus Omnitrophota bacterium]